MAQNITLLGASYSDVPAVTLPKTGGGTASFTDVTDTTAVATDVASGKYFYLADGTKTEGTASGGNPNENLAKLVMNTLTELVDDDGIITSVTNYGCYGRTSLTNSVRLKGCTNIGNYSFNGCSNITSIVLPSFNYRLSNREFQNCTNLKAIDLGGGDQINFSGSTNPPWLNDSKFDTLVIRKTGSIMWLSPIAGTAYTFNGTPFASNGTGGTLYVPSDLVNTYKTATNWSTWFGDNGNHNNTVKSIESTHTDPNAPIDLTTHYADGTLIPT